MARQLNRASFLLRHPRECPTLRPSGGHDMTIQWSPQQLDFINWAQTGTGSCVLEAVAGAGKTTTLLAAARKMRGRIAVLAYNKSIAKELKEKTSKDTNIFAGTVHSFGLNAYRRQFPRVTVDGKKVAKLIERYNISMEATVAKVVSLAKQRAI